MADAALPISLEYATLSAFQCGNSYLKYGSDAGVMVQRWIVAASRLPDTDEVCRSVVDTLLQIAHREELRPHIPVIAWEWLKKRPVLRRGSRALLFGGFYEVPQTVQTLGDIGITTSYLSVIWSEWNDLEFNDCKGMQRLIREELNGIRAVGCRADLIQRLDHVLSQLGERDPSRQYERFRRELLELDEEVTMILASMSPKVVTCFCLLTHMRV